MERLRQSADSLITTGGWRRSTVQTEMDMLMLGDTMTTSHDKVRCSSKASTRRQIF